MLQVLIALTTQFDWELDQIDVVGAYLNATLPNDEILYMDPIPGLHDGSSKVHRVVKLLYRLKQAEHISKTLSELFPTFLHFLGSQKGQKAPKEGPFLFRKADQRAAIARKAMKALKPSVENVSQNHTTFFFCQKSCFIELLDTTHTVQINYLSTYMMQI